MSYVAVLVVVVAVLVIVLQVLQSILDGIAEIVDGIPKGIAKGIVAAKNAFVQCLGRKKLGVKASIRDELAYTSNLLPTRDIDKDELTRYVAKAEAPPTVRPARFRGWIDIPFGPFPEPSTEIDIGQVGQLLNISQAPPYEPWFFSIGASPQYPVPPPKAPEPVKPPPTWTPWRLTFEEPSFKPPHYGPRLAFLNRFVDAAYSPETERVAAALKRRDELLAQCATRNLEVAELAAKAKSKFDMAVSWQAHSHSMALAEHARHKAEFENAFKAEQAKLTERHSALIAPGEDGLLARIDAALRTTRFPEFVSRIGTSRLDADSGILIHEHRFPDLSALEWVKQVELKSGWTAKPVNQKEKKETALEVYPSLCLRLACELARLDRDSIVKAVAINGWADYTEKATGQRKRAYCACLFATKEQLLHLNLEALDPIKAFAALKGLAARTLELTPIAPVVRLDTNDKRFVDGKEVLGRMSDGENLASMAWDDFEHLCRQLFEKAFAAFGAEVKVTQASRDQGVDAIIFDPDPLRGGKIVIQAKRYTNTVDVSAVRDLYGTVHNEGAIKGILVTTSHFGPESYSFAKDKPLTLIDGPQLLGLLEQHGYKFRIDLAEAKGLI